MAPGTTFLSNVWWLNDTEAAAEHLTHVNHAEPAIIRVDNTTIVPKEENRNTVRVTTKESDAFGSFIYYGCSVWFTFWTQGPVWPDSGEIDTIEGIDLQQANQMAIHTPTGCKTTSMIMQIRGIGFTNCGDNTGCTVLETKPNGSDEAFASVDGDAA
ncbi:uncharacterized protein BXZ73DRAFT_75187 [Epithele typhae]|uniref:uncharacterized protein n=1 Tax=Epithele typhae TaxID=378194 RepID=UPI0020081613|nr:uncharacterized protein BXZ73DRAFT_75187 [Epithele typhae]KAH9941228.1 hypothetical protein BXZ73DRAFT_75187 [Epithele typhae]